MSLSSSQDLKERISFLAETEALKDYVIRIPNSSDERVIRTYRSLLKPLRFKHIPSYLGNNFEIDRNISIDEELLNRILLGEDELIIPSPLLADYFILFDDLQMIYWSLIICYELRKIDKLQILIDLIVAYMRKTGSRVLKNEVSDDGDLEKKNGNFIFDNIFCIEIFNILKENFNADDFPVHLGERLEEERLLFPLLRYEPFDIRTFPKLEEYLPHLSFSSKSQYDPASPFLFPALENMKDLFKSVFEDSHFTNLCLRKPDGSDICRAHLEILLRNTNFFYLPLRIKSTEEYNSVVFKKEFLFQNVQIVFDTNTVMHWICYLYTGRLIENVNQIQNVQDYFGTLMKLLVISMMNCDETLKLLILKELQENSERILSNPYGFRKLKEIIMEYGYLFTQVENGKVTNEIFEFWRKPKLKDGEIHSSDEPEILDDELYDENSSGPSEEEEECERESESSEEEEESKKVEEEEEVSSEVESISEEEETEGESEEVEPEGETSSSEEQQLESEEEEEELSNVVVIKIEERNERKKKIEEEEESEEEEEEIEEEEEESEEEEGEREQEKGTTSDDLSSTKENIEQKLLLEEPPVIHCKKKYLTKSEIHKYIKISIEKYEERLSRANRPQHELIDESTSEEEEEEIEIDGEGGKDLKKEDRFENLPPLNESFSFTHLDKLEKEAREVDRERKLQELLALAALDQRGFLRYHWEENKLQFIGVVFILVFTTLSLVAISPILTMIMLNIFFLALTGLVWTVNSLMFILFEIIMDLILLAILVIFFGSYYVVLTVMVVFILILSSFTVCFLTLIPILILTEIELCGISVYQFIHWEIYMRHIRPWWMRRRIRRLRELRLRDMEEEEGLEMV